MVVGQVQVGADVAKVVDNRDVEAIVVPIELVEEGTGGLVSSKC